jgi:hypothetical protein
VEGDERLPQLLKVWPRVSGVAKRGAFLDLIGAYKRRSFAFQPVTNTRCTVLRYF